MNNKMAFYERLNDYLETGHWKALVNNRYVAVEIPKTKEMYYITVDLYDELNNDFTIDLMKGDLGLNYLMERLDEQLMPLDHIKRSSFISISFDDALESFPEAFLDDAFKKESFEMYKTLGYPFIFFKDKGVVSRPIDSTITSDLAIVFEALLEVPFKKLNKIKRITKKTTFETLFKKDGIWQQENRKAKINYEKIKYSDLEVYPLLKKTETINEVWHIVSVYEYELIEDEKEMKAFKAPVFEASVHILDSEGLPMNGLSFVGPSEEIPTVKKVIADTLRTYEVRPKQMVMSLKGLYEASKDFLKALKIEPLFKPGDDQIELFVEEFLLRNEYSEDFIDEEMFSNVLMMHFLEAKGVNMNNLEDLSDEKVDVLIDELEKIVDELMIACDQELLTNTNLEELSQEEVENFILDYIINGIDEKIKT